MSFISPGAVGYVLRRPRLWPAGLSVLRATSRPGWWAKWPPVPGPAGGYLSFRVEAMFGSAGGELSGPELASYLEWCRWMRGLAR